MSSEDSAPAPDQTETAPESDERLGPPQDEPPLRSVGPDTYELRDEVGRGGMGRVTRARDRALGREVALKELLEDTPARRDRFVREAKTTAQLQHPAIVPVYEAGEWPNGEPFYSMKLVSGATLTEKIRSAATLQERMALLPNLQTVAEAIAYAHSRRIIHRDLKSSNVVVGAFGETLVLDWGLAKNLGADEELSGPYRESGALVTRAGSVVGTPAFMSPEQARGDEVDARTDVFALGAILFHILSGTPPNLAPSMESALEKARAGRIATLPHGVPPELAAIYRRAAASAPGERYPNASEFASDLRAFQEGRLVPSHEYSAVVLIRRWLRRHRIVVSISTLFVFVVAVVGLVSLDRVLEARRVAEEKQALAERQRSVAVAAQDAAETARDEATLARASALLDVDPTAALAIVRSLGPRLLAGPDVQQVAVNAVERGVARHVVVPGGPSADIVGFVGDRVAFVSSREEFRAFDTLLGVELEIEMPPRQAARRRGAFSGADDRIVQAVVAGGRALLLSSYQQIGTLDLDPSRPGRIIQQWMELPDRYFNNQEFEPFRFRIAPSPSGRMLATAEQNGVSIRDQQLQDVGRVSDIEVRYLAAGEQYLAIVDAEGAAWLISLEGRKVRLSASDEDLWRDRSAESARLFRQPVAIAPEGTAVAYSVSSKLVLVANGRRLALGAAVDFLFSSASELVWTTDRSVHVLDIESGLRQRWDVPTAGRVSRLAASKDGRIVVVGDTSGVAFSRSRSDVSWQALRGHAAPLTAVAVSDDGARLITGDASGQVRVWNAVSPGRAKSLERCSGPSGPFQRFDFDLERDVYVEVCVGKVIVGRLSGGAQVTLPFERAGLSSVDIAPSGEKVAVSITPDRQLIISLENGRLGQPIEEIPEQGMLACYAGGHLVYLGADGIFEWADGEARRLLASTDSLRCAVSAPVFVSLGKRESGSGAEVHVVNLETGDSWFAVVPVDRPSSLAVSENGGVVAVANGEEVVVFTRDQGVVLAEESSGNVLQLALSDDGRIVAISTEDGRVRQYDVVSGTEQVSSTGFASPDVLRYLDDGRLSVFWERGYATVPSPRLRSEAEMEALFSESDARLVGAGRYAGFRAIGR